MSGYTSERYDIQAAAATTKFYVIAASYRSGSTYLATQLWETGRLGAPWEYVNYENEMAVMMARLGCRDTDDYLRRLVELRSSTNGVFGLKSHFHHFKSALDTSAEMRRLAQASQFIYIDRKDKLSQAISMAKALQNNAWYSLTTARTVPLFYSFDLIEACVGELKSQCEGWWRWFGENQVRPFTVDYEELVRRPSEVVGAVAHHIDVDLRDAPSIALPKPEKQADAVNLEWAERFRAEFRDRSRSASTSAAQRA